MKIGILREGKLPIDKRVPLTPNQCLELKRKYTNIDIVIQPSDHRSFKDNEYSNLNIELQEDLSDCDFLFGVKEVPINDLIPEKTYFYFSHTIKQQQYNRELLRSMLEMNITMVDYETLTSLNGKRLIGFGRYAGIVGCYNGFLAYGKRTGKFNLKPAYKCEDRNEMEKQLKKIQLPSIKIIVTGNGRVGNGVIELIKIIGIKEVSSHDFLNKNFKEPVFVHLSTMDYNSRIDGQKGNKQDFYSNPKEYKSDFLKYAMLSDFFIAGHYYATNSPYLFTREDASLKEFKIRTIADISCDINGPIASTIRSSKIKDPIYGYNTITQLEDVFNIEEVITVMAVDNLPCELPKNSSEDFGKDLIKYIFPLLLEEDKDLVIERAIICRDGNLTQNYSFLKNFIQL